MLIYAYLCIYTFSFAHLFTSFLVLVLGQNKFGVGFSCFFKSVLLLLLLTRMQQPEKAGDADFLELLGFFKGPKFEAIASWMWSDPGYVEVRPVVTSRLQHFSPQLYKWLRTSGVDMDAIFGWISDQLGMDITPPSPQR